MPGELLAGAFRTDSQTSFTLRLDISKATAREAGLGMPATCGRGTSRRGSEYVFFKRYSNFSWGTSRPPTLLSVNSDLTKAKGFFVESILAFRFRFRFRFQLQLPRFAEIVVFILSPYLWNGTWDVQFTTCAPLWAVLVSDEGRFVPALTEIAPQWAASTSGASGLTWYFAGETDLLSL